MRGAWLGLALVIGCTTSNVAIINPGGDAGPSDGSPPADVGGDAPALVPDVTLDASTLAVDGGLDTLSSIQDSGATTCTVDCGEYSCWPERNSCIAPGQCWVDSECPTGSRCQAQPNAPGICTCTTHAGCRPKEICCTQYAVGGLCYALDPILDAGIDLDAGVPGWRCL
jgi:hypothetical protein